MSGTLPQSLLWLRAAEGRLEDLVAEYRRAGVIEAALPFGLLRGDALSIDADSTLLVTSVWSTPQSYDDWLASDERARVTLGVWPLLAPGAEPLIERREVAKDAAPSEPDAGALAPASTLRSRIVVMP